MPFEPGRAKTGGIRKGQKQARTMFREALEALMGKTLPERFHEIIEMGGCDPHQEAELLVKLMPYCYTKLNAVDVSGDIEITHTDQEIIEQKADELRKLLVIK